jgi:uncharacterized SAM-binding protein YcdF (DUF218 family)
MTAWELTNVTAQLLLPPGALIILGAVGLALARLRPRAGAALILLALAALYVLSMPIVGKNLLHTLEQPHIDPVRAGTAAAIVVLGGGSYAPAPEYDGATVGRYTLERVRYGARLQRLTGKPVLVSGGNPLGLTTSEGEQMNAALREFGVSATWVEAASRNTYENARFSGRILSAAGIDTVYVVTHAWHMPRAQMAFERSGLRVIPAPTGYKLQRATRVLDFVPSSAALLDSFHYFHEIVGIAWYRLRFARDA